MKNTLILIIAIFLLTSCGSNTDSVSVPDDFNSEKITSKQNQLSQILTKEMVANVVNIPAENIEMSVENNISHSGQYTALYSWATGKKKMVGKHEIDEYHSISIGFVKQMNVADFETYYGTNEGLQMQVDNMTKQEHFNKEIGTAEAKYIAEYAHIRKMQKLENVATMAFWETPMKALHILANDVAFTITANFGDDEALAKKKSTELVNAILNN